MPSSTNIHMKTIMMPNGMVVSTDDLEDILIHADIRTQLLQKVVEGPMDDKLLLEIMKELEYRPGYQSPIDDNSYIKDQEGSGFGYQGT